MDVKLLLLTLSVEEVLYQYVPSYVYGVAKELARDPRYSDKVLQAVLPIIATYPWKHESHCPHNISQALLNWLRTAPQKDLTKDSTLSALAYVDLHEYLPDFLQRWPEEQRVEATLELLQRFAEAHCDR